MSTKPYVVGLSFDTADGELSRFFPHAETVQSTTAGLAETFGDSVATSTTDELLTEVLRRSAGDAPALRVLGQTIIRAQLAETDREFAEILA
ncbi:MAG TPA: hypothetical protein VGK54_08345 [Chloroflexota bacterium]